LLLLTAIFFMNFLARIILAPLLPEIQAELGIGYRSAGNLFFILSTGYFLSLLSTGYLAGRFQHRTIIIASSIGMGLVLFTVPMIDNRRLPNHCLSIGTDGRPLSPLRHQRHHASDPPRLLGAGVGHS
jgi:MFS family permease